MALKRYDAVINGVKTILLLDAAEAERYGDTVTLQKSGEARTTVKAAPANKARTPRNKRAPKAASTAAAPESGTPPTGDGESASDGETGSGDTGTATE